MKRYTMEDRTAGYTSDHSPGLTLLGVANMTNWTDEDFDFITEMKVGDWFTFWKGIFIQRTQ